MNDIEKIHNRIFRRRLDNNKDYSDWSFIRAKDLKDKLGDKIAELLAQGFKVSGGYHTTSVRGFHQYYLMYKT